MLSQEEKANAELARNRAEEKRKAELAIKKVAEARLKREAAERARKEALDAKAQELARLDAERARLAAEPTFNLATVPINKLRPFFFFADGHQSIKHFMAKEEKIDLYLCAHGRRLSTAHVPLSYFFASLQERKEFIVHFHTEGLSDTYVKMALGLSKVENITTDVRSHHSVDHMNTGIWLSRNVDFSPCQPLPHGWVAQLNDDTNKRGRIPADERALTHQIAKEELITKQNAEIALHGLEVEKQAQQDEESQLLLEDGGGSTASPANAKSGSSGAGAPVSIMEQYGGNNHAVHAEHAFQKRQQFTHISKDFGSAAAHAEKEAEAAYARMQKQDHAADQPAYWVSTPRIPHHTMILADVSDGHFACVLQRCVVEMLHIAGLGPRKRGSMYAASGAQVAVEFRLFGQTLRTGFVPSSPPITLMDSHHQMHLRARQSALRRYFFASPRIFVAIMYSHEEAVELSRVAMRRRSRALKYGEDEDDLSSTNSEEDEEDEEDEHLPPGGENGASAAACCISFASSLCDYVALADVLCCLCRVQAGSSRRSRLARVCLTYRSC